MNRMRTRHSRRYVYVYYEGEGSEKSYLAFLRSRFQDVIIVKGKKGFYPDAGNDLKRPNSELNRNWDEINEIWFFFDIDPDSIMDGRLASWKSLEDVIRKIGARSGKRIKVRILMTTGCIEYWFLLHFERTQPAMDGQPFKEKMIRRLRTYVPQYTKAGTETIIRFADEKMEGAIRNGRNVMQALVNKEQWAQTEMYRQLYTSGATFSTIFETLVDLKGMQRTEHP